MKNFLHVSFLLALYFSPWSLFATDDSNWTSGKSLGTSMLNYFKSDMSTTISNPITTETQLSTVDGSKQGNAQLICSEGNSKEYLAITYSGTSDISITFQMDKNLDGTKESSWNFSGVSGICSNGVVKCSSGTWGNCQYYQWVYNSSTLQLSSTTAASLGGCYCVNSSCGSPAATEKTKILNDIAGGAGALISSSNSKLVITKTQNDGTSVKYWGQDYSNCNSGSMTTATSSNIDSLTETTKASEASNTSSAYYVVSQGATNATTLDSSYKSSLTSRTTTARNSATNTSGNDYTYNDSLINGTVSGSLFLGSNENAKYCEVQYTVTDTTAYTDGTNKSTSTTSATTTKTEIRECINDWKDCPVYNGETIKHGCGAISDFAEVTAALNAVSEAVKDMVCSTK